MIVRCTTVAAVAMIVRCTTVAAVAMIVRCTTVAAVAMIVRCTTVAARPVVRTAAAGVRHHATAPRSAVKARTAALRTRVPVVGKAALHPV